MFAKVKYSRELRLDIFAMFIAIVAIVMTSIFPNNNFFFYVVLFITFLTRFITTYRKIPNSIPLLTGTQDANISIRIIAFLIDMFISIGGIILFGIALTYLNKMQQTPLINVLALISGFLIFLFIPLYYILFPISRLRATPGQLLLGISIAQNDPTRPLYKRDLILRGIIKSISQAIIFVFAVAFFTKDKRGLHDFVGHTRVVQPIYQYNTES